MTPQLPTNEQRVYDTLVYYDNWICNPLISTQLGYMHNYTAKILSFLKKRGLVESRMVIGIDGKKKHYCEYRLVVNGRK